MKLASKYSLSFSLKQLIRRVVMAQNLKLTVRLPTSDILAIEVIAVESTRVRDILMPIRAAGNPRCLSGCSERHMRFVHKGYFPQLTIPMKTVFRAALILQGRSWKTTPVF